MNSLRARVAKLEQLAAGLEHGRQEKPGRIRIRDLDLPLDTLRELLAATRRKREENLATLPLSITTVGVIAAALRRVRSDAAGQGSPVVTPG